MALTITHTNADVMELGGNTGYPSDADLEEIVKHVRAGGVLVLSGVEMDQGESLRFASLLHDHKEIRELLNG